MVGRMNTTNRKRNGARRFSTLILAVMLATCGCAAMHQGNDRTMAPPPQIVARELPPVGDVIPVIIVIGGQWSDEVQTLGEPHQVDLGDGRRFSAKTIRALDENGKWVAPLELKEASEKAGG